MALVVMALISLAAAVLPQPAAAAGTTLLLEVVVNGYPTGKIGEFVSRDDALLVRPGELHDIGFRVPASVPLEPDGRVSLSRIPGLAWRLDQPTQTLYVTAATDLLLPVLLQAGGASAAGVLVESGTGASVNYDVVGTRADTGILGSGLFDLRGFSPYGVLSSGLLAYRGPGPSGIPGPYTTVRLDSTYTFSDPDAMRRYRAGDFISSGLGWTRPVHFGGAQVDSDFALRPDLVTMPLPLVSGTAAVPSTVDVLVNGVRVLTNQVQPGPFEVPQLPVVSGANTISMAVTNALGQQVTQTLPFYGNAGLLAPDLQSFSVEAGMVRRNWGVSSNDYGDPAASATWRRGLSSAFTAEAHAETTSQLFMAGAGGTLNVFNLGAVNFGAAADTGAGRLGAQAFAGVSRIAQPLSFAASATIAERSFRDIAAMNGDPTPTLQLNASLGLWLGDVGSIGVAYTGVERPSSPVGFVLPKTLPSGPIFLQPAQRAQIFTASYSVQVRDLSIYATGFRDMANDGSTGFLIGVTIPFGGRSSASAGVGGGSGGSYRQVQANQSAVAVGDWGYQVYGSDGKQSHQYGQLEYKSPWMLLSGGADHSGGDTTLRLESQGALSYTAGGLFASNAINDSFAVVDTNGVGNVRVLNEHREVGRTDSSGQLFVPDLRSFDVNHIEIDPTDVPADATVPFPAREVRPQDRSGVVVSFPIRMSHGGLLRLVGETGEPIPVGSTATLQATGVTVPVGYDGEAYVEDLEPHNVFAVAQADGGHCSVSFDYHAVPGDIPTIGPLTCRGERP